MKKKKQMNELDPLNLSSQLLVKEISLNLSLSFSVSFSLSLSLH